MNPVYCVDCDNVDAYSRKSQTYGWLCRKFKRRPKGAIAPNILDVDPPYERCLDVNRYNNCQEFTPKKEIDHAASET